MGDAQTTVDSTRTEGGATDAPRPGLVQVWAPRGATHETLPVRDAVVLGRAGIGALRFDDRRVSRRHLRVYTKGGRVHVEDLGSHNGTYVNAQRIEGVYPEDATDRDVIRIGHCLFLPVSDVGRYEGGLDLRDGIVVGPRLRAAWRAIEQTADFSATVLITGESGAGKELAARRFHEAGPRRRGPFVAVNCAAIPEGVAERLLFGARKGAFSGAEHAEGYLQAADGGTLFLDELGELDLAVQGKLLRVLETGEVLALGATRARRVDVRVCVATHENLRKAVSAGTFRQDLFYRVARPEVRLPALRDRRDEIPWLIQTTLAALPRPLTAHASLVEACLLRPWPGNIRELVTELKTAARRAHELERDFVEAGDLDAFAGHALDGDSTLETDGRQPSGASPRAKKSSGREAGTVAPPSQDLLDRREEFISVLRGEQGNISRAARTLGVHRTQLRRWLTRLGIDPQQFR